MEGKKRLKVASFLGMTIILSFGMLSDISWADKNSTNDNLSSKSRVVTSTENKTGSKSSQNSESFPILKNVSIGVTTMDSLEKDPIKDRIQSRVNNENKVATTSEKNNNLLKTLSSLSAMLSLISFYASSLMGKINVNKSPVKNSKADGGISSGSIDLTQNKKILSTTSTKKIPAPAPLKTTSANKSLGLDAVESNAAADATTSNYSSWALRILELTNKHRANYGLKPVKLTNIMMKSASIKANDMDKNNQMTHNSPTLGNPKQQMNGLGIKGGVAENVAMNTGDNSADTVFNMWKNSPAHNENLLLPEAKTMGIAESGPYFAQQFTF